MGTDKVRVWDLVVRVFHWSLVACFFTAYITAEEWRRVHHLWGYAVLGLVALRIVWGFIGTEHARFRDFVYRPGTVLHDLALTLRRRAPRFLGHSPAGGAMVLALLFFLIGTTVTGVLLYGADKHKGPAAALMAGVSHDTEELLEEVHELLANGTLCLVVLHVLGMTFTSIAHRENLVRAMFTGDKRPLDG